MASSEGTSTVSPAPAPSPVVPESFGGAGAGKIGMWIFLVTDGMGFGGMLIAYGVLRTRAAVWPDPSARLAIPLAAGMTLALLASSLTVLLALASAREGRRAVAGAWLAATVALGALFIAAQGLEYRHLAMGTPGTPAMGLTSDTFASTFYMITGFHGLHVLAGVVFLGTLLLRGGRGRSREPGMLEVAALYWHFVDLAWVPIFTFVYLLPAR